jgi:hypothetical protein
VGAFGDDAEEAVVAGKEGEDLRGFAVFGFAEAEAEVGDEGHGGIIIWSQYGCWRNDRGPMSNDQRMTNDECPITKEIRMTNDEKAQSVFLPLLISLALLCGAAMGAERVRVIVETDAGGDPDDEQSMVRFLLYANDFDVEGIIANRPKARVGENKNSARTGLGIVRRMVNAYGQCWPNLAKNDRRYPTEEYLLKRTVAGYDEVEDGVKLVIEAVDREDPRPVWFCNWGTDNESGVSCLKRALDKVQRERGEEGYAKFKNKIRLSSADKFGAHTNQITPAFPIWVDTFRPEVDRKRWYWQFSAITARAGGFDVKRDVLNGHGPLGELYPTNTTHPQKEGDTMTFLFLVPTGLNDEQRPEWGSWAGRYGRMSDAGEKNYYWANLEDEWGGTKHRENTLKRWAADLQNDFRARLDWCVKDYAQANHPPMVRVIGGNLRRVRSGERVELNGEGSRDPDGQKLKFNWIFYREVGTYQGPWPAMEGADGTVASFVAPRVQEPQTIHAILIATDAGQPPLSRYARVVVQIMPEN